MSPFVTVLLSLTGCLKTPGAPENFVVGGEAERTPVSVLCDDADLDSDDYCLPPSIERWLRDGEVRFLSGETFGQGASGVMKMRTELTLPSTGETRVVNTKWKPGPKGFSGLNNSPRKEVAAYEVQKLFLPSERWVAPPTVTRCVPAVEGTVEKRAGGKDFDCVWGVLSYWVDHLEAPETVEWERYHNDLAYRTAIADLNLFTYVISHRDTHKNNWYLSTDPEHVRSASVDNGVAFSGFKNFFTRIDWADIQVPALPKDAVDKLRHVRDEDLEALRVLEAWSVEDGQLTRVPHGPHPRIGGTRYDDGMLVHGLSEGEIERIRKRIDDLIERVDEGEVLLFEPYQADDASVADANR